MECVAALKHTVLPRGLCATLPKRFGWEKEKQGSSKGFLEHSTLGGKLESKLTVTSSFDSSV